jgi:hypothetical protein
MRKLIVDRYVIWRTDNVIHIDFGRETDPPTPTFPGANSLRFANLPNVLSDALAPETFTLRQTNAAA